jgi:predicted amidohydrolase YtcJ
MMLDLVVTNACILTVDAERPQATSIGIWNGRIVGLDEELAGVESRVTVDAGGATVAPGFHDAHCHTTSFGLGLFHLELNEVVGIGPTLEAVAAYADGLATDEWVIGFGFGSGLARHQYPDRDELDRAGGGRPVWLTHLSGHSCVVSSAALEAVGITGALDGTGRGRVVVDDDGRPTGLIEESAMDLIKEHVGPSSIDRLADAIDRATAHYVTEGITGFTDAGIGCPGIDHSPVELAAYQLAHSTGRLRTRARLMAHNELFHSLRTHPDDRITTGLDLGVRTGFGDEWLSLGAMKVWIDGSGLGHTAAVTAADGRPVGGFDSDPGLLRQAIIDAHRGGWQVACHTIGDAALDLVLDALEEAATGGPYPARAGIIPRHRIEHGVMVRPDQVARLARLRMTVVVQPLFVREFGDPLLKLPAGDHGAADYFRMRSLVDAGVPVVGSSDRPVAAGSPLRGIQAMVERTTAAGQVFGSRECLTATEALASYTAGGAHAAHAESAWGALTPRRLADLVVLDDDPTAVDIDRIGGIGVVATMIGGRPVHDPSSLFGSVEHDGTHGHGQGHGGGGGGGGGKGRGGGTGAVDTVGSGG